MKPGPITQEEEQKLHNNHQAVEIAEINGHNPILESARSTADGFIWAEESQTGQRLAMAASARDSHVVERTGLEAARIRELLPNLVPIPLGTSASAGFGDRLGLATPGHADSVRACSAEGLIGAIFAQQSMRENTRTGRTPQSVLDDATIGAFLCGWSQPVGADADHLKTTDDIDLCLAARYSFFTIDPGDFVESGADNLTGAALQEAFESSVPWEQLETTPQELRAALGRVDVELADIRISFTDGGLERAAVKYGAAVAHVLKMARHLQANASYPVELEVSVDETATPTTLAEHWYIASELTRLNVSWVSLAPRFVGAFEKGVEFKGDLAELAHDLHGHALVAREFGDYKLSLHSGSDKFMVYPIANQATRGRVHLKTAGTSYLEALRVVGIFNPDLLHNIVKLARERFPEEVKTYQISGRVQDMPEPAALKGSAIAALLEHTDARQVLHVTFGSALTQYGDQIQSVIRDNGAEYRAALRRHFERHLAPFTGPSDGS